jgi:hypothetical protein
MTQPRVKAIRALVPVMGAALAMAGCGSAASTGGSSQSPSQVIKRAAYVSSSAAGYRVAINLQEGSTAIGGDVVGTGTGSFNLPKRAGKLTLNLNLPGSLSAAGTLSVQEIISGQKLYVKLPSQVASKLPGAKPWIEIDLDQLGHAAGIQNLTSLFGGSGSTNPGQFLQYLRATSSGGVRKLGTGSVDGVQATHYRASIDLLRAPAAAPAAARASLRQSVSNLEKLTGLRTIPVDVWVDSQHLVRRVTMDYTLKVSGQSVRSQLRLDFLSYGPQPVPPVPSPGQVTSAGSLLSQLKG